jgi:hypothetical protein
MSHKLIKEGIQMLEEFFEISSPETLYQVASGDLVSFDLACKGHNLTVEHATEFARAVRKSKAMEYLDIYFTTQEKGALKIILEALKDCPKLGSLWFNSNVPLSLEDIQTIAEIIDKQGLNFLTLASPEIGLGPIFKCLLENKRLHSLNSSSNLHQHSRALAEAIQRNEFLTKLRLMTNEFDDTDISLIANAIAQNPTHPTTVLDLSHNKITVRGFKSLATCLVNPDVKISNLYLNFCELDDSCAAYLASVLKNNRTIQYLNIENNRFTAAGLTQIHEAILSNNTLTTLILGTQSLRGEGALSAPVDLMALPDKLSRLRHLAAKKMDENENSLNQSVSKGP